MNLPNALTVGRIAVTPLIALLPLAHSVTARLLAFVLFTFAAVSDYVDGRLARSRKQETDLGRLLDPLADKLLLVGTFIPMFWLAGSGWFMPAMHAADSATGAVFREGFAGAHAFPFITPLGPVPLPWWVVVIVLGREIFMTIFRQTAARRGVVISAIGPAKWKTAIQLFWQGSAYFWFFIATLALARHWDTSAWRGFAYFNGTVGTGAMAVAVVLTVWSLVLYLRRYGTIFAGGRREAGGVGTRDRLP